MLTDAAEPNVLRAIEPAGHRPGVGLVQLPDVLRDAKTAEITATLVKRVQT